MSPARRARLARLTPRIIKPVWPDPEKHRRGLLHHVEFGLVLRETLPRLGVDPSQVKMLRVCDKAAEELRKLGHEVPDRPAPDSGSCGFSRSCRPRRRHPKANRLRPRCPTMIRGLNCSRNSAGWSIATSPTLRSISAMPR